MRVDAIPPRPLIFARQCDADKTLDGLLAFVLSVPLHHSKKGVARRSHRVEKSSISLQAHVRLVRFIRPRRRRLFGRSRRPPLLRSLGGNDEKSCRLKSQRKISFVSVFVGRGEHRACDRCDCVAARDLPRRRKSCRAGARPKTATGELDLPCMANFNLQGTKRASPQRDVPFVCWSRCRRRFRKLH